MSKFNEVENFILKEFYEGKSVEALVRDYDNTHTCSRREAEKLIYDCLNKGALVY